MSCMSIPPQPPARQHKTIRQSILAYLEGSEPATAVMIASVIGEDRTRIFDQLKAMVWLELVMYTDKSAYPEGTRFPFATAQERHEKTLFELMK